MQTSYEGEGLCPWHEGERAVQERLGVADRADKAGRAVRRFLPDQHREFFAQLPFLVVGSVDADGWPWASLLFGPPGFVGSPDPKSLHVAALPPEDDPLRAALAPGAPLGLLGIDLSTRRRNRANGRVAAVDGTGFHLAVDQSFGNCPRYIQRRDMAGVRPCRAARSETLTRLDEAAWTLIGRVDTCFVASCTPPGRVSAPNGADVSHRGGAPGFLGRGPQGEIIVPDYAGNHYFNTLGNLTANPRAGLLFVDFETGDLLQVTGTADIVWDGPEIGMFEGAERLWRLRPCHARWWRG